MLSHISHPCECFSGKVTRDNLSDKFVWLVSPMLIGIITRLISNRVIQNSLQDKLWCSRHQHFGYQFTQLSIVNQKFYRWHSEILKSPDRAEGYLLRIPFVLHLTICEMWHLRPGRNLTVNRFLCVESYFIYTISSIGLVFKSYCTFLRVL